MKHSLRLLFKNGVKYHTYDFDDTFSPDFIGDLMSDDLHTIPDSYEAVCAYQCLYMLLFSLPIFF